MLYIFAIVSFVAALVSCAANIASAICAILTYRKSKN